MSTQPRRLALIAMLVASAGFVMISAVAFISARADEDAAQQALKDYGPKKPARGNGDALGPTVPVPGIKDASNPDKPKPARPDSSDVLVVSAHDLCAAFLANQNEAEKKYGGKRLAVSGKVLYGKRHTIEEDADLTLDGETGGVKAHLTPFLSIVVFFDENRKTEAAKIFAGQVITIRGTFDSNQLGNAGRISMKKCDFLKVITGPGKAALAPGQSKSETKPKEPKPEPKTTPQASITRDQLTELMRQRGYRGLSAEQKAACVGFYLADLRQLRQNVHERLPFAMRSQSVQMRRAIGLLDLAIGDLEINGTRTDATRYQPLIDETRKALLRS